MWITRSRQNGNTMIITDKRNKYVIEAKFREQEGKKRRNRTEILIKTLFSKADKTDFMAKEIIKKQIQKETFSTLTSL